jgi:hypothetical protein
VWLSADDIDSFINAHGEWLDGYFTPHKAMPWEIVLYAGQPREELVNSLLHEHIHAAFEARRYLEELSAPFEERAVGIITPALLSGLRAFGWTPPPLPPGWRALAAHARHVRRGKLSGAII